MQLLAIFEKKWNKNYIRPLYICRECEVGVFFETFYRFEIKIFLFFKIYNLGRFLCCYKNKCPMDGCFRKREQQICQEKNGNF